MNFTLIKDKIPKICQKEKKECDYAVAANNEFYAKLLRQKLVDFVNDFLIASDTATLMDVDKDFILENFTEILTVMHSITKLCNVSDEDLDKKYFADLEKYGLYTGRYIGFFPDAQIQQEQAQAPVTEEKTTKD